MGLTDSYAYFLPVHALYQIVSIKLCHNKHTPYCHLCFSGQNPGFFRVILAACLTVARMKKGERCRLPCEAGIQLRSNLQKRGYCMMNAGVYHTLQSSCVKVFWWRTMAGAPARESCRYVM